MRDIDQERKAARRHERAGEFLDALEAGFELGGLEEGGLREIRIRYPVPGESNLLLIVKGWSEVGKVIAFTGGASVVDALLSWRRAEEGAGLKWREDLPYGEWKK